MRGPRRRLESRLGDGTRIQLIFMERARAYASRNDLLIEWNPGQLWISLAGVCNENFTAIVNAAHDAM